MEIGKILKTTLPRWETGLHMTRILTTMVVSFSYTVNNTLSRPFIHRSPPQFCLNQMGKMEIGVFGIFDPNIYIFLELCRQADQYLSMVLVKLVNKLLKIGDNW